MSVVELMVVGVVSFNCGCNFAAAFDAAESPAEQMRKEESGD